MPTDSDKMNLNYSPSLLALDFDGVICNGLAEYFQTTRRAYIKIWQESMPGEEYASAFYRLRPVIESGWEMPVLLRALVQGVTDEEVLNHWEQVRQEIVTKENIDSAAVSQAVDAVRDIWIQTDLEGWLALHEFYPGVIPRLKAILESSAVALYIVTTKEGRFVKQLLQQQGISLSESFILGKEVKRAKPLTLRNLIESANILSMDLWFVEDRLETLQSVQEYADLQEVSLFLADWGYNTERSRATAVSDQSITLLSLSHFAQDFSGWMKEEA